jgi:anthranilate 1,2-dioxygenase large subunit
MSQSGSRSEPAAGHGVSWPSNGISEVPYRVYTDRDQYGREQERIFQGPIWHYLCLEVELAKPGDYVSTTVGEVAVIACRAADGAINAFENRCVHRGNLLCLERQGNVRKFSCIYHGWTYDLTGKLTGVAFERGVNGQGGMAPEFRKEEHALRRLRVATMGGLVFGTFSDATPDLETWLGPDITRGVRRVMNRTPRILGRSTQVLPNNWKLYFENVKDSYHASILHLFFTTFRINRLTQPGGIYVNQDGGSHYAYSMLDYAAEDTEYKKADLRSDSDFRLRDSSVIESVDEYGDGVSLQLLSIFPAMVLQQIRNTIAVRVVRPRGIGKTELEWIHLGFDTDDEAMTERRLRQGNLIGSAGYISMEDGCVGGFVQRALHYNDDGTGYLLMGGHEAESQTFRTSETAIRGFWKHYRSLMGD